MKTIRRSGALTAAVMLALAATSGSAALAAEVEPGWRLRVSVASVDFDSRLTTTGYGIDIGAAGAVGGEYRFNRRLGLDLGAFGGGVDVTNHQTWIGWSTDLHDTLSVSGLTAGLDIHLTPEHYVDLYLRPMVAMMRFGGLTLGTGPLHVLTPVDFDDDLAVGASLAFDAPIGESKHWSFNAQLSLLTGTISGSDRGDLRIDEDYDLMMGGVGFGYRF